MTPTLRSATAEDISAVQAIYAHHVLHGTGTFEIDPPSVESMRSRWLTLSSQGYPYLVVEVEGEVIGFGYLGPFRERPAYRHTVEDSIYLHPDKRGKGVGNKLLTALIEAATKLGFTQMIALIGDSDNRASVAVHARCGFETTGTIRQVGQKFDRWLDVVIMQRALGNN
tara:strand:+ start:466 stop:972 length:507 start_codon:yes stop_codon:yes gene_type:complete